MYGNLLVMKNNITRYLSILCVFTVIVGIGFPTSPASAQAGNTSGQALEIGPPVLNISANPGEAIHTKISLRDISSGSLVVQGQVNDFVANGEDGTPKILLEEGETSPYSFKNWVTPLPRLTLKSKELKNLPITINVPGNASPGGYYGVIRFTATPPELEGTGVSLSASLGALVLLKVNGDAKESLSIEEFSVTSKGKTSPIFESAPLEFIERLHNTGNIHQRPSGVVTITDMFGNTVATLGVNQPPRDILPQSIRKFTSSLDSTNIGNKVLFGLYKAELSVTYGSTNKIIKSNLSFWVIPYTLIGLGIAVLIIGFFALRFLMRRYNRHIIAKAKK